MKKRFESGSAKRKKYMENQEKINKLPKLTQFFNKVSAHKVTSCASTSASIGDDSENIENVETSNDHQETISSITEVADVEDTHAEADQEQSAVNKADEDMESTDPGLWPVSVDNLQSSYWIDKGPAACANRDSTFLKSARLYIEGSSTKTRNLCASMFKRQLRNGEVADREWLIYSPSKGKVYCFVCKLFSSINSAFTSTGFNDWKHAGVAASQHENSPEHRNCTMIYQSRLRVSGRIDTQLTRQFNDERQYWKEVLRRIVAVIKFLASRGLPFRGENENIGSVKNGNYLGTLELLSQFDPFLDQHIKKYGNAGKGNPSYLSATICEEFIELMGSKVLATIVAEVRKAKYYSVSVDFTPDVTHVDQLTFILRYVKNAVPIERFLQFIHIHGHTAEYLADVVVSFLEKNTILLDDCRGQSYDNASNMSGQYSGLQTRLKQKNKYAEYVPCAGHSLNLIGVQAVECNLNVTIFFDFVQNLYNFFSSSTHRWEIMNSNLKSDHKVLKSLSKTRWSAREDAVTALNYGYKEIQMSLDTLSDDKLQSADTRLTAKTLNSTMDDLETTFLTIFWNDILTRINKVNLFVQKENLNLSTTVKLFKSLMAYIKKKRDSFDFYESKAKEKSVKKEYRDTQKRVKRRSVKVTFLEGNENKDTEVTLQSSQKFRVETYLPIIDCLISNIDKRGQKYEKIFERFGFFEKIFDLTEIEVSREAVKLSQFYDNDINTDEFILECEHFKSYISIDIEKLRKQEVEMGNQNININEKYENKKKSISTDDQDEPIEDRDDKSIGIGTLYTYMFQENIFTIFPNIEIAMRIFLSMMVTNASGERSFSKLKIVKSEIRNRMSQSRLNHLSLMSIESEILQTIDFEEIIHDFASVKSRKRPL